MNVRQITHRAAAKFLHATPAELTAYLEDCGLPAAKSYSSSELSTIAGKLSAAGLLRFDEDELTFSLLNDGGGDE
jgi:crotonobetainyl-CoA:carnitine CoA-transferase CaiB-like acyl-CoA transferase